MALSQASFRGCGGADFRSAAFQCGATPLDFHEKGLGELRYGLTPSSPPTKGAQQ